jgi:hypothetical protein
MTTTKNIDLSNDGARDLRSVTPTICSLLEVDPPHSVEVGAIESVMSVVEGLCLDDPIERILIYNPDAIGRRIIEKYAGDFKSVIGTAPIEVELRSIFPPVTPVCFASMYTGANPSVHGIDRYKRPVVETDSLFDCLPRAGKKVAIVAIRDCSLDLIFRNRNIDYCIEETDQAVIERTIELIEADAHDVIVSYNLEYDQLLHRTGPDSPECIAAMRRHIVSFTELASHCQGRWEGRTWAVAFAPDHGGHDTPEEGGGSHGLDIPEDMNLMHFWGVWDGSG